MLARDILIQNKIAECEKKIALLHKRFPRLEEIAQEVSRLSIERIRVGLIERNTEKAKSIDKKVLNLLKEKEYILKANNLPLDIYEPDWDCPQCKDRGYIEPGVLCECFKQERYDRIFSQSGLIGNMREKTFANFNVNYYLDPAGMEKKVERCKEFAAKLIKKEPQNNLFFTGEVGRGKTHMSVAIANEVMKQGVTVIYKRIDDLLDIIREYKYQREENGPSETSQLEFLVDVDLLIIDDLGTESLTPFAENQLRMLIEDRNNLNKPWIINSNLSIKELQTKYGQRITDRIIEKTDIFAFESSMSIRELLRRGIGQ
ncbi:MAG: ATP-binding protein [Clostridia bacterium]|nr:ATP-binding protein [Clostridia bacterium]